MLRVLLPPNLAAAATRNAIAVRIELAPDSAPDPALLPALAWIQRQTGAPSRPPLFLQFTRGQLRELIALAEDQPVFFWVNRPLEPIVWDDGLLPGPVSISMIRSFRHHRPLRRQQHRRSTARGPAPPARWMR